MGAVLHLRIAEQQHIVEVPVIIERVAPGFLVLRGRVDLAGKEEGFASAVIPSLFGRKHIVILPEIGRGAEYCPFRVGMVVQHRSLDEHGVCEHIYISGEGEQLRFGIVGSVDALYDLPILVLH